MNWCLGGLMQLSDNFYRDGRTIQVKSSFLFFSFLKQSVNTSYRAPVGNPLTASQTMGSDCNRDVDQFFVIPAPNTGALNFLSCSWTIYLFKFFDHFRICNRWQGVSCWSRLFRKQLVWRAATSLHSRGRSACTVWSILYPHPGLSQCRGVGAQHLPEC